MIEQGERGRGEGGKREEEERYGERLRWGGNGGRNGHHCITFCIVGGERGVTCMIIILLFVDSNRRALEAKVAVYERLSKGQGLQEEETLEGDGEEEDGRYLVDFTRKAYEEVRRVGREGKRVGRKGRRVGRKGKRGGRKGRRVGRKGRRVGRKGRGRRRGEGKGLDHVSSRKNLHDHFILSHMVEVLKMCQNPNYWVSHLKHFQTMLNGNFDLLSQHLFKWWAFPLVHCTYRFSCTLYI